MDTVSKATCKRMGKGGAKKGTQSPIETTIWNGRPSFTRHRSRSLNSQPRTAAHHSPGHPRLSDAASLPPGHCAPTNRPTYLPFPARSSQPWVTVSLGTAPSAQRPTSTQTSQLRVCSRTTAVLTASQWNATLSTTSSNPTRFCHCFRTTAFVLEPVVVEVLVR